MSTPWNDVLGHRMANSQEFAIDVVDYRRGEDGRFVLSIPPDSEDVKDYFLFERDVLAVGDGVVVSAGNQWPNRWADNPLNYSEERVVKITQELLEKGMAFDHAILGNYVIIDHQNGEFSLYAHMSEGSLTVDIGDAVKQGQVIGKVGNTSNSDFPHLHFQLMDSPDFQTANGLPVLFKDVPLGQAPFCDHKESNSLLYSDYLFVFTDRETDTHS
jgi:murein DD-endopeptidase MepM/ murein hydrolase activator NlpD